MRSTSDSSNGASLNGLVFVFSGKTLSHKLVVDLGSLALSLKFGRGCKDCIARSIMDASDRSVTVTSGSSARGSYPYALHSKAAISLKESMKV